MKAPCAEHAMKRSAISENVLLPLVRQPGRIRLPTSLRRLRRCPANGPGKRIGMKISSPQAELSRAKQREIHLFLANKHEELLQPYWELSGIELVSVNFARMLKEAIKREEQYVRIIKSMGKPKKAKPCRNCLVRKLRARITTKEKPTNVAECRKIIASIEECWPGFKKVPELLWNQYNDSAGRCKCGRVIAPKLVSKSANVRFCCSEHRQNEMTKKNRARRKEYAIASKALAEGME